MKIAFRTTLAIGASVALLAGAAIADGRGRHGAHDPAFSGNGEVRVNVAAGRCVKDTDRCFDYAQSVATDSHDRVIVTGVSGTRDDGKTGIVRLKPSGKLDRSFSGDGRQRYPKGADGGQFLAIDSHNRILVGNDAGSAGIARLLSDGSLDRSFGENGRIPEGIRGPFAVDEKDRIVVATRRPPGADEFGGGGVELLRYGPDGQPDPAFADEVVHFGDPESYDSFPTRLALDSDGRAVVSGLRSNLEVQSYTGALARWRPDGTIDKRFGTGGVVNGTLNGALAIDHHRRIVLGSGSFGDGGYLERYRRSGAIDTTFSGNGRVRTGTKRRGFEVYAVAIDGDNRVIAAGDGRPSAGALARYRANGKLDRSFARGGRADASFEEPAAVTVDDAERIVTAGRRNPPGRGSTDFAVARYLGN